ncbi:MAG: hypothetical protein FJ298_12065 [Planctomycetes bacterium]|nr:hypothetical protein [Planctomycetota bacterium]
MNRPNFMALAWVAAAAFTLTNNTQAQCVGGGAGGAIPTSGTGGSGTYPNVLPPFELQADIAVSVPTGATCLTSVKLQGLTHTWNNDVQFVLADPAGGWHNLLRGPGATNYSGDYEVFDRVRLGTISSFAWAVDPIPSGQGVQDFGGWPNGTVATNSGGSSFTINNTPLEQIPISSGTWTLYAFDWFGGDVGALTSFELCFGTPFVPPPPPPPPTGCSSGPGGAIPTSGTGGGGAFPTTFPVNQLSSQIVLTSIPSTTSRITSVKLKGLTHTWGGDVQFVLTSPSGTSYNIGCAMPGDPNVDWNFVDVSIVDTRLAGGCAPTANFGLYSGAPAAGTYAQEFGGWVDGTNNVFNTPLELIPLTTGTWTLDCYDWVSGDTGSITGWDLCLGAPSNIPGSTATPFSNQCIAAGAPAAAFPATGAADGVWPTVLPTGELASTATITAPSGATLEGVKLIGFQHTWSTDAMVVLTDPAGNRHMLLQLDNGSSCGGCGDDFNGDYTIVGCTTISSPIPGCGATIIPSGEIAQTFGTWPSGSSGINNTPMAQIPALSGAWTLTLYDWCVDFDDGFLNSWELCFTAPATPVAYCTAGTTTNGCNASISATANPSVSGSTICTINVANVEGQKSGLIFYSITGRQAAPWNASSFLCVKAPTQRTTTQNSGGTAGACNGLLTLNWNTFQASNPTALGNPWATGSLAQVQAWFRDPPAGKSTNLSDGIEMTYVP